MNYKLKNIYLDFQCDAKDSEFKKVKGMPFCNKCNNTVYDLTNSNNEEVHSLLNNKSSICASFYNDQLEEPYSIPKESKSKNLFITSILGLFTVITTPKDINAVNPKYSYIQTDKQNENSTTSFQTKSIKKRNTNTNLVYQNKKPINLFRIQRRYFYINRRFPFFHAKRRIKLMGKVCVKSVRHL